MPLWENGCPSIHLPISMPSPANASGYQVQNKRDAAISNVIARAISLLPLLLRSCYHCPRDASSQHIEPTILSESFEVQPRQRSHVDTVAVTKSSFVWYGINCSVVPYEIAFDHGQPLNTAERSCSPYMSLRVEAYSPSAR